MPFHPVYKGHKRAKDQPKRVAAVELKMADMPRMIAEYRKERRDAREKVRKERRFKTFL